MTDTTPTEGRTPSQDVAHPLAEEFAGIAPPGLVRAEVRRAERDLRGEVPGGALPEFVHRLARERLRQRLHLAGAASD
jgi:hypothetical protein